MRLVLTLVIILAAYILKACEVGFVCHLNGSELVLCRSLNAVSPRNKR